MRIFIFSSCSQPFTHASGAHGGRTAGVSLFQPPFLFVAVGRCWLRAAASRSRNLGSGNSTVTFRDSPRIPDICAVAVGRSVSQWLGAERGGDRRRQSSTGAGGVKIWRAALRCSPRLFPTEHRLTVISLFLFSNLPLGSISTGPDWCQK